MFQVIGALICLNELAWATGWAGLAAAFRDERPKVGFGRSGQSNKLAPVPELAQVGEPTNQLLRADWPSSSTLSVFAPLQYLNRYSKRTLRTCRRMQTASSDPLSKPSNRAYLAPVTM